MKITKIENVKGDKYKIYVDDEYWYILDLEVIARMALKVGKEVDEAYLEEVRDTAEYRKARERAYYLLGYRDHSSKELFDKLKQNVSEETAAKVVALVIEQGLVDDEKYAEKLAEYYTKTKKWGKQRAVFEMQKKGLDKETAVNALDDCQVDYVEQITEVIRKKYWRNFISDDKDELHKGKQKTIAALMRLGFSYDDIKRGIIKFLEEEQEEK